MINSLSIQNFQSHKDSTLNFHPGMNVIIGKTDSGKTSIIRALRKLIQNKPSGEAFRSDWGGDTEITINLSSGETISRIIKNSKNLYILNNNEFTAFGQDIPEEIVKALNLSEINLQQQFDKFFLIQNTPGEVAKHFNKIAHLDVIDKSIAFLNKETNQLTSSLKHDKKRIEELKEELKKFDSLDEFEKELNKLDEDEDKRNEKENKLEKLKKTLAIYKANEKKIRIKQDRLKMEGDLFYILDLIEEKFRKQSNYEHLKKLTSRIKRKKEQEAIHENNLLAETDINNILSIHGKIKIKTTLRTDISKLSKSMSNNLKSLNRLEKALKEKENTFNEKFPDVCPLCNTELS